MSSIQCLEVYRERRRVSARRGHGVSAGVVFGAGAFLEGRAQRNGDVRPRRASDVLAPASPAKTGDR